MNLFICNTVLFYALLAPISGLRVLDVQPLNCTQSGLRCKAKKKNCFDKDRIKFQNMTPTGPWGLELEASVRRDENGVLVPVVVITWKTQTDGSIKYLKGTEVHMLKISTNFNLCVLYKFLDNIDISKKLNEWWSFSLDQVVVDPEEMYIISVSNLPKPNLGYDSYYVARNITIPGCHDQMMRWTKVCIESGSLWEPNANLSKAIGEHGRKTVTVNFYSSEHSKRYRVFLRCPRFKEHQNIPQENLTVLRAVFDSSPASCCVLDIEIQPFFIQCKNYCLRHRKTFYTCFENDPEDPSIKSVVPTDHKAFIAAPLVAVLFFFIGLCALFCYKKNKDSSNSLNNAEDSQKISKGPRKVLIIYSLDHPLYKDIVLKLCAFLQAQCGTEVVLDLLDSTQLSSMGRLQWLELQKERVEESSDKILILCSRGVQAKWQAMCEGQRVILREDAHSPIGDMLTPAFSVIIPDLLRTASFGKYVVAYFGGVCCEEDVPSPFNITVKYKLMNHFEEVYLRILEKEKFESWKINHVEGITEKEYHKCPSGGALRDAIEAFQAYQLENPDWFEKECMNTMEELAEISLQHPLLERTYNNGIFSFIPEFENVPLNFHDAEVMEDDRCNLYLNAITSNREERISICEQYQLYSPLPSAEYVTSTPSVSTYSSALRDQLWHIAELEAQGLLTQTIERLHHQERSEQESNVEKTEEELHSSPNKPSPKVFQCPQAICPSLDTIDELSHTPIREKRPCDFNPEKNERKEPWSGSDRGYISRTSLQTESCSLQKFPKLTEHR
ncbi:interleukin 17 receptor A1a [Scleropages formosus]|uniref:interleukin 17 receptor A1a n=1 Tax=Scleropages formosus TaxID=113540 RepID=UPI0010FA6CBA|nr:interleukin-17 receptor A-like [Scleropages formosus]